MHSVGTYDLRSRDQLQRSLLAGQFEPVNDAASRWKGPLPEYMHGFTDSRDMVISIRDGWPFRSPQVYIEGLRAKHVSSDGLVCLWREDEQDREQWLSLEAICERLEEWSTAAEAGFPNQPEDLDAHLYFEGRLAGIAIVDNSFLGAEPRDGDRGRFHASRKSGRVFHIPPEPGSIGTVAGVWYFRSEVGLPPRSLSEFEGALDHGQRRNFARRRTALLTGRGSAAELAMLAWHASAGVNVVVLKLDAIDGTVVANAVPVAPSDPGTLSMRAGDDFAVLQGKSCAVFGAGSVGSYVALLLSEMGMGEIALIDADRLRPGNVVRHAGGKSVVGYHKVSVVKMIIGQHAPQTDVLTESSEKWNPDELEPFVKGADVVVDATGSPGFALHLSAAAHSLETPYVSVALFRRGSVGRIVRLVPGRDTPPEDRDRGTKEYPAIPEGESELAGFETGCSSPVACAPPSSVVGIAATAAAVIVDTLTGRFDWSEEVAQIFAPLPDEPFSRPGMLLLGKGE